MSNQSGTSPLVGTSSSSSSTSRPTSNTTRNDDVGSKNLTTSKGGDIAGATSKDPPIQHHPSRTSTITAVSETSPRQDSAEAETEAILHDLQSEDLRSFHIRLKGNENERFEVGSSSATSGLTSSIESSEKSDVLSSPGLLSPQNDQNVGGGGSRLLVGKNGKDAVVTAFVHTTGRVVEGGITIKSKSPPGRHQPDLLDDNHTAIFDRERADREVAAELQRQKNGEDRAISGSPQQVEPPERNPPKVDSQLPGEPQSTPVVAEDDPHVPPESELRKRRGINTTAGNSNRPASPTNSAVEKEKIKQSLFHPLQQTPLPVRKRSSTHEHQHLDRSSGSDNLKPRIRSASKDSVQQNHAAVGPQITSARARSATKDFSSLKSQPKPHLAPAPSPTGGLFPTERGSRAFWLLWLALGLSSTLQAFGFSTLTCQLSGCFCVLLWIQRNIELTVIVVELFLHVPGIFFREFQSRGAHKIPQDACILCIAPHNNQV